MIGTRFSARARAFAVATAIVIARTAWIAAQQSANTGSIQGTVTDDRGLPLPQTYVAVAGPDIAARSVLTNDEGRFSITNLPDGDVMLTASKRGYTSIAAGQRDIDLPGRPIGVVAGRPVQLALVMPRAASIDGAVVTLPGSPPGVGISIYRERPGANAAGSSLVTWRSTFTSSGTYRLDNLPPGRYVVRAGRTFFGDTAALASATRITLAPGEARTGADIRVAPAPTGRLEVSVSVASGPPAANPQVWVFAKDNPLPDATRESVTRRADGLYVADALVPGRYDVIAMTSVRWPVLATPARVSVNAAWAIQEVEIAPGAPASVTLAPAPGRILSGTLRTDPRTPPGISTVDRIGISLVPQDLAPSLVSTLPGQIVDSVMPNGVFTLTGVPPGRYVLRLSTPSTVPPNYAKAVTIDGRDVTDMAVDITSDISGIEIVVGERPGTIAGHLIPADGIAPIQSAMVFSDQEQHWRRDSSRVQVAPLSTAGRFSIRNLPAGGYLVAIVDASTAEAWSAADLTKLKSSAVAIAVSDGERTDIELRAANGRTTMVGTPATAALAEPVAPVAGMPAATRPTPPPATSTPAPLPPRAGLPPGAPGPPPASAPIPGAGSISGIVTDPDGRPAAGLDVRVLRRIVTGGSTQFATLATSAKTDAQGFYRIENVLPGPAYVVVLAQVGTMPVPARALPVTTSPDGRKTGAVTTFFPGVTTSAEARVVTIASQQEMARIDFALRRGELVDVTGRIAISNPNVRSAAPITLLPVDSGDQVGGSNVIRSIVSPDGSFVLADVPLGRYVLSYNGPDGYIRQPLDVTGAGAPLVLATNGFLTVTGRVVIQSSRPEASDLSKVTITLTQSPMQSGAPLLRVPAGADGSFTIPRVPAGRYVLGLAPPSPWTAVSGVIGGTDTLDRAVDIAADVADAKLVITDRDTSVRGIAQTADGKPTAATVVVFADDMQYWVQGSRRVRIAQAGPGGTFLVSGLAPGRYHVAAVALLTPVNNALLTTLRARTPAFDMALGEQREVRVTPGGVR